MWQKASSAAHLTDTLQHRSPCTFSTMQESADLLDKYKKHPFAKGLLPFQGAVRSLSTPWPSIYAKQDGHQRWIVSIYSLDCSQNADPTTDLRCKHQETCHIQPCGEVRRGAQSRDRELRTSGATGPPGCRTEGGVSIPAVMYDKMMNCCVGNLERTPSAYIHTYSTHMATLACSKASG